MLSVLTVTELDCIVSENVTEMLSEILTPVWLLLGEIEETVGGVVSAEDEVVLSVLEAELSSDAAHADNSNAILINRAINDSKFFIFPLLQNVEV